MNERIISVSGGIVSYGLAVTKQLGLVLLWQPLCCHTATGLAD